MLYYFHKLLNEDSANKFAKSLIASDDWIDGKFSNIESQVKRNLQLNSAGEDYNKFSDEIINLAENDNVIKNSVFPAKVFNIVFSRTGAGMFYGPHLDVPYLKSGRRDLSFTLFLNEKKEYTGGELILYVPPEKKQIKLNPGEMIIYPTKYLHEVKEVTEGERLVCVGWIESQIPDNEDRESLSMINSGIGEIIKNFGRTNASQTLKIGYNHLFKRLMNN